MITPSLDEIEKLAREANDAEQEPDAMKRLGQFGAFRAYATPDRILALLSALRAAQAERDELDHELRLANGRELSALRERDEAVEALTKMANQILIEATGEITNKQSG